MQGDDTSDILTDGKTTGFNTRLQRYLTDNSKSVSEAISLSFDELTPETMKKSVDPAMLITFLVLVGFIVIHAFFMVFYDPNRKYRKAVECPLETPAADPTNSHTETCPYCGASYMSGAVTRCPNCQALLVISDKK